MLLLLACSLSNRPPTVIPAGRPVSYEIQVATATSAITPTPSATAEPLMPLVDVPTYTPNANAPLPTDTPTMLITDTPMPVVELTATPELTATKITTQAIAAPPTAVEVTPVPPLQGGEWDFEGNFVLWTNPYGDCSGALVGAGWTAFVEKGPFGSSCMGENKYAGDVQSGLKSQEIMFDFIAANSGILRTIPTNIGHRYKIVAYAKHVHSIAPVQMSLGIDMSGGTAWDAETVQWFAWHNPSENVWVATDETVTATGESMTLFIKGYHPQGDQGGKTYLDNVSVTDLGK